MGNVAQRQHHKAEQEGFEVRLAVVKTRLHHLIAAVPSLSLVFHLQKEDASVFFKGFLRKLNEYVEYLFLHLTCNTCSINVSYQIYVIIPGSTLDCVLAYAHLIPPAERMDDGISIHQRCSKKDSHTI